MIIETQTPSIYIKDQSLSAEVEEWLKTHKAKVLPSFVSTQTGYTRDYTKTSEKKTRTETKKAEQSENGRLAKIDLACRKAQINDLFGIFEKHAKVGDLVRLSRETGIHATTLSNAKNGRYTLSHDDIKKLKDALDKFKYGEKGEASYKTLKARQEAGRLARLSAQTPERIADLARQQRNRDALNLAIMKKENRFMAEFPRHGITLFSKCGTSCRCEACKKESSNKSIEKKANLN